MAEAHTLPVVIVSAHKKSDRDTPGRSYKETGEAD